MDPKIKRYNKKFEYSYAFGTYPTIDLLKLKPEKVIKVLLKQEGFGSEGIDEIVELCKQNNIKYEVNDRLIDKIAVKENTYSVGIFNKYEGELSENGNHIVLVNPRNLGNMGTIIRTMVGFGFKDLAIIRPAGDIFDPGIVRSAMGALFRINFRYFENIDEYTKAFGTHKLYLFMLKGSTNINEIKYESPYSLVLGNESQGLPDEFANLGTAVFIQHSNEIDSLNLSVAASIAMYKASLS